ncbi:hypothetical protein ACOME3_007788 [Neoechinorhynchus agilis]
MPSNELSLHEHNLFGFDLNTRRLFVASVDRLDICLHFLFRRIDEAGKCLSFCCNGIEAVFGFRCGHMFTYRLLEHDPRDPKGLRRRWTRICESIPIIGLQQLNQKQGFIGYNVLGDVFVVSGSTLTWLDRQSNQGLIAWNRDCCNSYEIAMVTIRAELKVVCPRDLKTRCVKFNAHDVSQISCSKKILDPKVPRRLLCLFLDGTVRAYDLYHGNDTELVLEPKYQCRFLGHCRRLLGSKSDWFILGAGDRLYKLNQNQLDLFDNDVIDAHGSSNGTICVLTFENLKILNDGLLKVEPIKSLKKPAEITIGIDCKTVAVIDSSHVHAMNI